MLPLCPLCPPRCRMVPLVALTPGRRPGTGIARVRGMSHRSPDTAITSEPATTDVSASSVPTAALLESWAGAEWTDGCQVDGLTDMQPLTVVTRNTLYEIFVVAGGEGRIRIRGGHFFPSWTEVVLAGSTLGGSFLKMRGVYAGFCMELHSGGEVITTSPVRRLTLTPIDGCHAH